MGTRDTAVTRHSPCHVTPISLTAASVHTYLPQSALTHLSSVKGGDEPVGGSRGSKRRSDATRRALPSMQWTAGQLLQIWRLDHVGGDGVLRCCSERCR